MSLNASLDLDQTIMILRTGINRTLWHPGGYAAGPPEAEGGNFQTCSLEKQIVKLLDM